MIVRLIHGIASRIRRAFYAAQGMQFAGPCWLRNIEVPRGHREIRIGRDAALDRGVTLIVSGPPAATHKISIGAAVYINRYAIIDASESITIGSRTMIGPHCYITDHDHAIGSGVAPGDAPLVAAPVDVGESCWVGAHVTILKGVTIGAGAVIGAGSVVTKSIPASSVAVGNPARVIRSLA
jgi:acetyltransferase-like isoleucine patch superfamily enzyme